LQGLAGFFCFGLGRENLFLLAKADDKMINLKKKAVSFIRKLLGVLN
jgi:hypothetical protein